MKKSVLNNPVLVLNKTWSPIRVVPVHRAIKTSVRDRAMILDTDNYNLYRWQSSSDEKDWVDLSVDEHNFIKTTSGPIRTPEIVVLAKYDKLPPNKVRLNRKNIFLRDQGKCQYTGEPLSFKESTIDHIKPKDKGGKHTWENVVLCSKETNVKKGNRTPEQAGLKLHKKPNRPNWEDVFMSLGNDIPDSWKPFLTHIK